MTVRTQVERAIARKCEAVIFFTDASVLRGRILWLRDDQFGYAIPPFGPSAAYLTDVVRVECVS